MRVSRRSSRTTYRRESPQWIHWAAASCSTAATTVVRGVSSMARLPAYFMICVCAATTDDARKLRTSFTRGRASRWPVGRGGVLLMLLRLLLPPRRYLGLLRADRGRRVKHGRLGPALLGRLDRCLVRDDARVQRVGLHLDVFVELGRAVVRRLVAERFEQSL